MAYLFTRHGTYWFQISVPQPLRPVFGSLIRQNLQTTDRRVAQPLAYRLAAHWMERFACEKVGRPLSQDPAQSALEPAVPELEPAAPAASPAMAPTVPFPSPVSVMAPTAPISSPMMAPGVPTPTHAPVMAPTAPVPPTAPGMAPAEFVSPAPPEVAPKPASRRPKKKSRNEVSIKTFHDLYLYWPS